VRTALNENSFDGTATRGFKDRTAARSALVLPDVSPSSCSARPAMQTPPRHRRSRRCLSGYQGSPAEAFLHDRSVPSRTALIAIALTSSILDEGLSSLMNMREVPREEGALEHFAPAPPCSGTLDRLSGRGRRRTYPGAASPSLLRCGRCGSPRRHRAVHPPELRHGVHVAQPVSGTRRGDAPPCGRAATQSCLCPWNGSPTRAVPTRA